MAQYEQLHEWNLTPREAVELQKQLRAQVRLEPLTRKIETVAGADISFNKFSPVVYAGLVVLRLPDLAVIEEVGVVSETQFPYVPGLLSFRESPSVLEAWAKLKTEPDAVMFDGQGIAHPRRVGIASHVGLLIKRPTFGCAKSVLVGKYDEPELERGSWTPLVDPKNGETVGAALADEDEGAADLRLARSLDRSGRRNRSHARLRRRLSTTRTHTPRTLVS